MRNSAGYYRQSEKRAEYRKRRQFQVKLFLAVLTIILLLFALRIRALSACLVEVQTTLKRMEALQQSETESDAGADKDTGREQEGTDDIGRIEPVDVGKPVKRTREEAVQRLNELGKADPVIAGISQDNSRYPEDLLVALANNPEMAEFAAGYPNGSRTVSGGLTDSEKEQEFPLFLQWDPRWGYSSYGKGSNIGLSGCGPTCMAMVLYYLTGNETFTPDKIADYAMSNGYYVEGTGTAWALMKDVPRLYGVKVTEPEMSEYAWRDALGRGRVLICAMGPGDFTVAGHFIVIYGYDENGFMVNDPNCVARSRRRWSFDEIRRQIKMVWAYELRGEQMEEEPFGEELYEEKRVVTYVAICNGSLD